MAAKALFEFVTQCVTNSDHRLKMRHEASDESISATASHLLKAFESGLNKSEAV
jgi:hypothetical protein